MYILNERNKANKIKKDNWFKNIRNTTFPELAKTHEYDYFRFGKKDEDEPMIFSPTKEKKDDIYDVVRGGRNVVYLKPNTDQKSYVTRKVSYFDKQGRPIYRNIYHLKNGTRPIDHSSEHPEHPKSPSQKTTEPAENNAPSSQAAKKSKNKNIKIGAGIAAGALGATAIAIGAKVLYDRKKYKEYLKNHPNSKLTFKEWKNLKKINKLNESIDIELLESYNDGSIEYYQAYYEELDKMYLEEYFDTLVELDEDLILESIFNEKGYEKYVKKMRSKGQQPLPFEQWKKRNIMIAGGVGAGIAGLGTAATIGGINTYKNVKTGRAIYKQTRGENAKPSFMDSYRAGSFTRKAVKGAYKVVPKEARKDFKNKYKKNGVYL